MRDAAARDAATLRTLLGVVFWVGIGVLAFTRAGFFLLCVLVCHPGGWGGLFLLALFLGWLAARRAEADTHARETTALARGLVTMLLVFFGPFLLLFFAVAVRAAIS